MPPTACKLSLKIRKNNNIMISSSLGGRQINITPHEPYYTIHPENENAAFRK